MIRGVTRGLFLSARQVRRAAARQQQKQQGGKTSTRRYGSTRKLVFNLVREESVITNQQKRAFGRTRYIDAIPRILSVGALGILDVRALDTLNVLMQDLVDDDDDGR